MQNDIEGLVLGKFNGRHSGTLLTAETFTKTQEFYLSCNFCICSLQQQFVKPVSQDHSGSENKGRGVGPPELEVLINNLQHCIHFLPHLPSVSQCTSLLSHLGRWEAVVVEGVPLLLNLTLHSSCGLIFGRLDTTRWQPLSTFA